MYIIIYYKNKKKKKTKTKKETYMYEKIAQKNGDISSL